MRNNERGDYGWGMLHCGLCDAVAHIQVSLRPATPRHIVPIKSEHLAAVMVAMETKHVET